MLARNESNLYLEYCKQAAIDQIRHMDEKTGPVAAQLAGEQGSWCGLVVAPQHERVAAAHLSGRGFGIYLPEVEVTEIRRGRKVDLRRLLIPGYLFVYLWGIAQNHVRVRNCPGIIDFMRLETGAIRVIKWDIINELRVIENLKNPISLPMDEVISAPVHRKRRWRRSRKQEPQIRYEQAEIVCVHAYSPFVEELREAGLDDEARISAFQRRLGLSS